MVRQLETLRHVPLRSLTDDEVHSLDPQCSWRRYETKEQTLGHSEGGMDVFFVISGAVRALIRGGNVGTRLVERFRRFFQCKLILQSQVHAVLLFA